MYKKTLFSTSNPIVSRQGQPIHRLDGPRLRVLLIKARGLGGDRLTIDIMEAEAALQLYGRVEESATVIQVRPSPSYRERFVDDAGRR